MSTDETPPGGVLVIGASLEAERVVHLVRRLPDPLEILGLIAIDPATERVGHPVAGHSVIDTFENVARFHGRVRGAIPASAEAGERETILAGLDAARIAPISLIHPQSCLAPEVTIRPGAIVHANAVLDVGVQIGRGAVIGCGAIIGPGSRVGDFAEVAPGTVVGRGVRIGERARLALGSRVVDGVLIGPDAAVAAGSLVQADLPRGAMVIGNPAQPMVRPRHPEVDPA